MPGDCNLHCEGRVQSTRAAERPPHSRFSWVCTVRARWDGRRWDDMQALSLRVRHGSFCYPLISSLCSLDQRCWMFRLGNHWHQLATQDETSLCAGGTGEFLRRGNGELPAPPCRQITACLVRRTGRPLLTVRKERSINSWLSRDEQGGPVKEGEGKTGGTNGQVATHSFVPEVPQLRDVCQKSSYYQQGLCPGQVNKCTVHERSSTRLRGGTRPFGQYRQDRSAIEILILTSTKCDRQS